MPTQTLTKLKGSLPLIKGKGATWKLRGCPVCRGDMHLEDVREQGLLVGREWQCLQCGRTCEMTRVGE